MQQHQKLWHKPLMERSLLKLEQQRQQQQQQQQQPQPCGAESWTLLLEDVDSS